MAKYSINLLQADLIPRKELWTLGRVVALWLFTLVIMLVLMFASQFKLNDLNSQYQTLNSVSTNQKLQIKNLELTVENSLQDEKLVKKLNVIKLAFENKQYLHQLLTDPTQTYSSGFSSVMTELAELHDRNISLTRVDINSGHMTFSGLARTPDAVPNWLSGFESSTFLSGKNFINFTLSENEQNLTEFVVSSSAAKGE